MEGEKARYRRRVVPVADPGQRGKGGEVGAVREAVSAEGVEKRLFAEAVAREMQDARIAIEDRQCVHAVDALEEPADSPAVVALCEHLGVARRGERRSSAFELATQRTIVVDLAILEREHAPVARGERLPSRFEIDYGEPAHAHRDPRLDVHAFAIGAAHAHRVEHRAQDALGVPRMRIDQSGDAAHGRNSRANEAAAPPRNTRRREPRGRRGQGPRREPRRRVSAPPAIARCARATVPA